LLFVDVLINMILMIGKDREKIKKRKIFFVCVFSRVPNPPISKSSNFVLDLLRNLSTLTQ